MVLGLISLGGGLPSSDYYPFEELSIKVPIPSTSVDNNFPDVIVTAGKNDIRDGKSLYGQQNGLDDSACTNWLL